MTVVYETDDLMKSVGAFIDRKAKSAPSALFILIPRRDMWRDALARLQKNCPSEIRISEMMDEYAFMLTGGLINAAARADGATLLYPLSEMLRGMGFYPARALLERLGAIKRSGLRLIIPLIDDGRTRRLVEGMDGAEIISIAGAPDDRRRTYVLRDIPVPRSVSLRAHVARVERGELDEGDGETAITVDNPAKFSGSGRIIQSCHALLCMAMPGFESEFDRGAISGADWREIYQVYSELCGEGVSSAARFKAACGAAYGAQPGRRDIRRCLWLLKSGVQSFNDYTARVLARMDDYESIEEAAALEIIALYDDAPHPAGALDPGDYDDEGWLKLRRQRAELLRHLGVRELPKRFWAAMERVPLRRRLLFTSLCTRDEREFCRSYLIGTYHLSYDKIAARSDVRQLFPELLGELRGAKLK